MNYEGYKEKEVEAAILSRKVQARVGHPSYAEFKNMGYEKYWQITPLNLSTSLIQIIYLYQSLQD